MGNQASRQQGRKLPKAMADTLLHQHHQNQAKTGHHPVTSHKLDMKHLKESAASHSQAHSHAHTGTGTGTGTGTIYEGALNDRESRDAKTKENAKRMQFIKMEEIPLKLDQNHPSLSLLRNKARLESVSKRDVESRMSASAAAGIRESVTPSEFIAIVDDLGRFTSDQIKRNYNVGDEFLEVVRSAGLEIANQKVQVVDKKGKRKNKRMGEESVVGQGGKNQENSAFQDTLENLLKH